MGESSACLVRSTYQPSPTSPESKEGDPLRHALTTSVSFGRFFSESLAWEKWSSFTHNRYLEDVEKYSKPGSVAEKKAYFEAHYKRIAEKKAAALVEQQNAAVHDLPVSSLTNDIEQSSPFDAKQGQHATDKEGPGEKAPLSESVSVDANGNIPLEEGKTESAQIEGTRQGIDKPTCVEKEVESSILLEDVRNISDTKEVIAPVEDVAVMGVSAFPDKKTPTSSPAKPSGHRQGSGSQPRVKPATPMQAKNSNNFTLYGKKNSRESMDRKRSTPKSLHMSINFASHAGDTNKTSSTVLKKIANPKNVRNLAQTSRDSSNQQTPTRASANGLSKHISVTPQPENERTKAVLRRSVFGSATGDRTKAVLRRSVFESVTGDRTKAVLRRSVFGSATGDSSKPSTTRGTKAESPIVSSSVSLKSEERAAKRKEFFQKLEENMKMRESEKEQLQAKLKGKTRNNSNDVCQSVTPLAKANASDHQGKKSLNVTMKKIPKAQPCSPRIGWKQASEVPNSNSRPPWRLSLKTDSFKDVLGKNHRPPAYSVKLLPKKRMDENSSPNIQYY